MSLNGQEIYQVVYPGPVREELMRLRERAVILGLRDSFLQDLNQLHHGMTTAPHIGEPAYRLPFSGRVVYRSIRGMLFAYYAVSEINRVVFVKSFAPSPGHQLGQAE